MENINIGICNIPTVDENNSANYCINSKTVLSTDINYYPSGLIELDLLSNHFENRELEEIAAPNNR